MMRVRIRLLLLLACSLTFISRASAQDLCPTCTTLANRDVFARDMSRISSNKLNVFFFMLTHVEYLVAKEMVKKAINAGLSGNTITEAGIPYGGSGTFSNEFDERKFKEWQVAHREQYTNLVKEITYEEKTKVYGDEILMKGIVDCVERCTRARGTDVHVWHNLETQNLVHLYVWYTPPPGDLLPAIVEEDFRLPSGVTIEGRPSERFLFRKGQKLNVGINEYVLNRAGKKEEFAVGVKTKRGGQKTSIPAVQEVVVKKYQEVITRYIDPKYFGWTVVGATRTDERGYLVITGEYSAYDPPQPFYPAENCCFKVRITNLDTGRVEAEIGYAPNPFIEIAPRREVSVFLNDDPNDPNSYRDNRSNPQNPVRANLYLGSPPNTLKVSTK
jgi:hypothetical protein